jgi:glycerate kinase
MGHIVAAPDKFRQTAGAPELAGAAAAAARGVGWTADEIPLSDGGEGLLDAFGGSVRTATVSGPLGEPTDAEWRFLTQPLVAVPTAVIEMAKAAGRDLLERPQGNDALDATTTGVGQLILAAIDAGAQRVIVGCGGSATTDGGAGAVDAIGSADRLDVIDLVVATDTTNVFEQAAAVFGPQKGATPEQVAVLEDRLRRQRADYLARFGLDVGTLAGGGAAGGLAGGLVALGGRIAPGFALVADFVRLDERLEPADVVMTGEGRLDATSFRGKVVGQVIDRVAGRLPVLCVVGDLDPAAWALAGPGVDIVSLTEQFGEDRARRETAALVEAVVVDFLSRR